MKCSRTFSCPIAAPLLGLLVFVTVARAEDSLLPNGGMESWQPQTLRGFAPETGGVLPEGWTVKQENPPEAGNGHVSQDSEIKKDGDSSLRIENRSAEQSISAVCDLIPITPGQKYLLSGYLRGENLNEPLTEEAGILVFFNQGTAEGSGTKLKSALKRLPLFGTFDWEYFEIPILADADSDRLRVALQLRKVEGVVWVDDLRVVPQP
ncbi:MAG TPA: hypothetical protein PLS03_13445 [Terrimicrobiaceae bacterium]|nr:hypothetical protein [Terrimicrobiaceae bacterium]